MFCNINTTPLSTVKSVASLLSAAEMLESSLPDISGSFITYAFMLCEDHFSRNPTNALIDESFSELKDLSTISTISSAKELEQFGDSILAAADDSTLPNEMYRLAYLSYSATSIHGPTSHRVNQKMKRIESRISPQRNDLQSQNNMYQQTNMHTIPNQPPVTTYGNYPNNFNLNSNNNYSLNNIPQQPASMYGQNFAQPNQVSDNSMLVMPSYPKIESPHFDRINKEQSKQQPNLGVHTDSSHSQPIKKEKNESSKKCKELVEIAKVAFKNGSLKVAYAAMAAAIKELETNQ